MRAPRTLFGTVALCAWGCSPGGQRLVGDRLTDDAARTSVERDGAAEDGRVEGAAAVDAASPPDVAPSQRDAAPARDVSGLDAGSPPALDAPLPPGLPVLVTDGFPAQGWFGDADVARAFAPGSTVIRQERSTSGACAARRAGARGACLAVTYTPPPDLTTAPGAGFVGVVFLPVLRAAHPELTPPARAGDPNWGAEPGVPVPSGAKRVSFYAAAPTTVTVTFGAGIAKDGFVAPTVREALTPDWRRFELALPSTGYGAAVLGGFSWALTDTRAPAAFYVDDVVWE